MKTFLEAKQQFDNKHSHKEEILAFLPVDLKFGGKYSIKNSKKRPNEGYYKWQFFYGLIHSGLYPKDYLGSEVYFPKGSKKSEPIKLDGAIFDDTNWIEVYKRYWKEKKTEDLEWMSEHLLAVVEFKRGEKEIERVFTSQIKPAMKEKDPSSAYVLGIYYDQERLFLFHRRDGLFLRYDESKNQKGNKSKIGDLSLHLPDPYIAIPSFDE